MAKPYLSTMGDWMRSSEDKTRALSRRSVGGASAQAIEMYDRIIAWTMDPSAAGAGVVPDSARAVLHRITTTDYAEQVTGVLVYNTVAGVAGKTLHYSVFTTDGALIGHAAQTDMTGGAKRVLFDVPFEVAPRNELWLVLQSLGGGTAPTLAGSGSTPALNTGLAPASPYRVGALTTSTLQTTVNPLDYNTSVTSGRAYIALETAP